MLTERVRKREKKKLERVQLFKTIMDDYVFPKDKVMRDVLQRIAQYVNLPLGPQVICSLLSCPIGWTSSTSSLDQLVVFKRRIITISSKLQWIGPPCTKNLIAMSTSLPRISRLVLST